MSLRSSAKKLIYGYLPGLAGRFPYYGTTVHFPPKAFAFDMVCRSGIYEADNVHVMTSLARPNTFVFDVGGNLGLMAIPVLATCPACTVVSFEPSPTTLSYLRRTAGESSYGERWKIVGKALGSQSGTIEFFVAPAALGLWDGLRDNGHVGPMSRIEVEAATLDEEWDRLGQPDVSLIKIDVEGAEYDVLLGARRTLAHSRPAILTEWVTAHARNYQRPVEDIYDLVRELGYQMYAVPQMARTDSRATLRAQLLFCSTFLLLSDA
jgi:FkbM family methyltransferase